MIKETILKFRCRKMARAIAISQSRWTNRLVRGKYLSLEEARKSESKGATIKQFCKEHPSKGDGEIFDRLLDAMVMPKSSPEEDQTSTPETSEDYTETQTRRDT